MKTLEVKSLRTPKFFLLVAVVTVFVTFFGLPAFSQTQEFRSIKAVEFKDGTIVQGKIIEMNADIIRIQKPDGSVEVRKFKDATRFFREGESPEQLTQQQPPQQQPEPTGLYFGLFGGYVIPFDTKFKDQGIWFNVDVNNSWLLGAKFGFNPPFANFIGIEVEYNHLFQQDIDRQTLLSAGTNSLAIEGDVTANNLLFNLILRYPNGRFHPYVGGGAGWTWWDLSRTFIARIGPFTIPDRLEASGGAFAWQILGGLNIDISRMWSIDLGYKYFNTEPIIAGTKAKYSSSMITAGVSIHF